VALDRLQRRRALCAGDRPVWFPAQGARAEHEGAAIWTAVWVALSLGFNALIWHWEGYTKALEFLTGYVVEYSLSVDNIFVFVLVFSYFAVPAAPCPLLGYFERADPTWCHDRRWCCAR
jgi:hypothetical protein